MKELIAKWQGVLDRSWSCDISPDHELVKALQEAIAALQQSDGPRLPECLTLWEARGGGYHLEITLGGIKRDIAYICPNKDSATHAQLEPSLPKPETAAETCPHGCIIADGAWCTECRAAETAVEMNVSSATVETSKGSGDTAGERDAAFLLERLDDFEREIEDENLIREWAGNVVPAMTRLRDAIATPSAPRQEQSEDRESLVEAFEREFGEMSVDGAYVRANHLRFILRKLDERLPR